MNLAGSATTPNLPQILRDSLLHQLTLYGQIHNLQEKLLQDLDSSNQLDNIMNLLGQKSSLLDSVQAENARNAPFVDEWVSRKDEMQNSEFYVEIEQIISNIEKLVMELRAQDEKMIMRFDQHSQSQNRLNAMRALR